MPYDFPISCTDLMQGKRLRQQGSEAESIARHIGLILHTNKGENHFDPEYGVRKLDFQTPVNINMWKGELQQGFAETLEKYETRLTNLRVEVTIVEDAKGGKTKRLEVGITGYLESTSEAFATKVEISIGQSGKV